MSFMRNVFPYIWPVLKRAQFERIAIFINLSLACDGKGMGWYIAGDNRSCSGKGIVSDGKGGNQRIITTNVSMVHNDGFMFVCAVMVARNGACAYVDMRPNGGVTQIG